MATPNADIHALLAGAVANVTVHGLATSLGSDTDRLEEVVPLLEREPAHRSPAWGCRVAKDEPAISLIVIPPLEPQVETRLREGFQARNNKAILAVADTCAVGGVNVIYIEVAYPKHADSILTGFLTSHAHREWTRTRSCTARTALIT